MITTRIAAPFGNAPRVFVCSLAIASIAWGSYALPVVWRQSSIAPIASQIIEGNRYQAGVLPALVQNSEFFEAEKWSHPSAIRDSAVIRLRILENDIANGDQDAVDIQMVRLHKTIDKSLASAPADPFLWAVLFWLENTQNGYSAQHLKYLRASYSLGPNEGWIAVKRNRIAVVLFTQLPPDLAEDAKAEFVRMVDSHMYGAAADILVGPGWGIRSTLLANLKDATDLSRQLFARTVYSMGYDVSVPGVRPPDRRPWQ